MIELEFVTYSEPEWDAIKAVVLKRFGKDADQIERRITPVVGSDRAPAIHQPERVGEANAGPNGDEAEPFALLDAEPGRSPTHEAARRETIEWDRNTVAAALDLDLDELQHPPTG